MKLGCCGRAAQGRRAERALRAPAPGAAGSAWRSPSLNAPAVLIGSVSAAATPAAAPRSSESWIATATTAGARPTLWNAPSVRRGPPWHETQLAASHEQRGAALLGARERRRRRRRASVEAARAAAQLAHVRRDGLRRVDGDRRDQRLVRRASCRRSRRRRPGRPRQVNFEPARRRHLDAAGGLGRERREARRVVERRHRAENRLVLGAVRGGRSARRRTGGPS